MNAATYLLGIDIGSSSVKASLVHVPSGKRVAAAQSPAEEMVIVSPEPGWAEQDPEMWWENVVKSVRMCLQAAKVSPASVVAIGLSYQMHGLVLVGKDLKPLRPSIIWCDSRAVELGEKAFSSLGPEFCLQHYLNSPGNFTASKLRWVRDNQPDLYRAIYKVMLPGEYIALKLTGEILTTSSGLSEGIFWDFKKEGLATDLLSYYDIDANLLPKQVDTFSLQGKLTRQAAEVLGLTTDVILSYRAGDQPNNALSLGVIHPGETAATAGTSGVIYSVTDKDAVDSHSRVNTFVHVSNNLTKKRNGVLLCVNGTGSLNRWLRSNVTGGETPYSYEKMNTLAQSTPIGSEGLSILPFGNGAERILQNKQIGSSLHGLDFNRHHQAHFFRASQEGIVFALTYGLEILQGMGLETKVIKAGHSNMFLSPLFREAFVNTTGVPLELYETDGATGAALGAGIGAGCYNTLEDAFQGLTIKQHQQPTSELSEKYLLSYEHWKNILNTYL